jgi:integrase
MQDELKPSLTFEKAAEMWINSRTMGPGSRARYISPRTLTDLQQYIRALNRKFGTVPLKKIHIGLLREYQNERSQTCRANKINQELGTLLRIMKRARAWTAKLDGCYEPLQHEEADIARAMTPEEQKKFLDVASSREEWRFVYYYALLALATSASNCEMRGLRIGDMNLYSKVLHIRREHAKNRYRIRTIPMHDEAVWAANRLIERARTLGATAVEQRHPETLGSGARGRRRALAAHSRSSPYGYYANGRSGRSHSGNPEHGWTHQHAHATALHCNKRLRQASRRTSGF